MDGRFMDIMNSVGPKPGRSRLEPYGDLVEELREPGIHIPGHRDSARREVPVSDVEDGG